MKPVCIIPARGGSKRIPRKNIAEFNGKPLIAWSIETAISSDLFSQVVVSTDDQEIAEISKQYGASIPFIRDDKLADDFATTADVLKDALARLPHTDYACCLYPTAPMITPGNLSEAWEKLRASQAACIVSVTEFDFHPLRAFNTYPDGKIRFQWPENALVRSQDLPEMLHDAGAFYFFDIEAFLESGNLIDTNTLGFHISRKQAVDIDTQEDFELARALHRIQRESVIKHHE